jgi:hypothetical protein
MIGSASESHRETSMDLGKWLKHEEDAEVKDKMTESCDKYDNVMVG